VTSWAEFAASAPGLATVAGERLERDRLCLVGTIRRDGSPRISPVEPLIADGELYLGMMPRSRKALDLLRDPRCVVHSVVADRSGAGGEFKLYGRVRDVTARDERERYCRRLFEAIGWRPEGDDYHLFALSIDQAAHVRFVGGERRIDVWRPPPA
jgi:hypothetical protein